MHQFGVADTIIQEKVKAQIRVLQQQVLYAISTDVEGLRSQLHDLMARLVGRAAQAMDFWEKTPLNLNVREEFIPGQVDLFDFELPTETASHLIEEEKFDLLQQRDLFLALLRAEEGTLKDIIGRLDSHLNEKGELRARDHTFPQGLAEYYVLSEIGLFTDSVATFEDGEADIRVNSKRGRFVLRRAPAFTLRRKESVQ